MRSYSRNSPQAAARIVALTLLADGHLAPSELDVMEQCNGYEALGLSREDMHAVLHGFCEDLLHSVRLTWSDACQVDSRTLSLLLSDVDDPSLRLKVLQLCLDVAQADEHIADGESLVLQALLEHWGLQGAMFQDEPAHA
ncbi:TerB family tellurite resistance protein [uncultured Piscinibacter sp.]|uniref:TerB family tellurite resistance protein n=1 Tax=uncultured Piscinibacter sp. TaxID=1131835 RepID=UPI00260747F0|nr:TerB family tellurite resistance protein [uncultured Piscinibacter sp.]